MLQACGLGSSHEVHSAVAAGSACERAWGTRMSARRGRAPQRMVGSERVCFRAATKRGLVWASPPLRQPSARGGRTPQRMVGSLCRAPGRSPLAQASPILAAARKHSLSNAARNVQRSRGGLAFKTHRPHSARRATHGHRFKSGGLCPSPKCLCRSANHTPHGAALRPTLGAPE